MWSDLEQAVRAVVRDCLGVKAGEVVVVVGDPTTRNLAESLRAEATEAGAEAVLAFMEAREMDGNEPPDPVAAAMAVADVVIGATLKSISHTVARRTANENGARIATLPGIEDEVLARMMSADMPALRRRSEAVAAALSKASEARLTCPNGSDLRLGLHGREGIVDDGDLTGAGAFGNLPCGEGFISPLTAEGRLVIDGTIASYGMPKEPADLSVRDGRLAEAQGEAGEWLLTTLRNAGEEGTNVAELGVGTNEKAELSPNLLEAEKILGTVHVAFGASAGIGGTVQVPVHIDGVVTRPTLELEGEAIVREGELLV